MFKVLIVDDDKSIIAALKILLDSENFDSVITFDPEQALVANRKYQFDAAIVDLNFRLDTTSGQEGLDLISKLKKQDSNLPIVVLTGWATIELAVQAMQKGAGDFIQKPWENERLLSILNTQISLAASHRKADRLEAENSLLKTQLHNDIDTHVVARSAVMRQLEDTLRQAAASDINVLFTGENGTGKSLLAQHLHNLSARRGQAFIAVNMGAITETLFESEMFGHVKGAFTDAARQRIGRVELADSGTLFLDEIGNIPLPQQSKLLRVLEDKSFEKVGSSKTQQVDVRLISATNADLDAMVAAGKFRQDLLYRLNTLIIHIPPLWQRSEDIEPLAERFLTRFTEKYQRPCLRLSASALIDLQDYPWPGNVRELQHVLERAVVLSKGDIIQSEHLLLRQNLKSDQQLECPTGTMTLDEIEKQVITARIKACGGNMKQAAQSLGLSRSAFYRRIEKFQL